MSARAIHRFAWYTFHMNDIERTLPHEQEPPHAHRGIVQSAFEYGGEYRRDLPSLATIEPDDDEEAAPEEEPAPVLP